MTGLFDPAARPFRRIALPFVAAAIVATVALVLIILITPGRTAPALHWYLVVVSAIVVAAAIRALTVRFPMPRRSLLTPARRLPGSRVEPPARLSEIDRLVAHATWDAADFQARLRPLLHEIATQRLTTYRTIDLDADPDAARAALGEQAWTFLTPTDLATVRREQGVDLGDLRATIERLEGLNDVADD